MTNLALHHLQDLEKSGLSLDTALAAGVYSADPSEVATILGFTAGPGLVFRAVLNDALSTREVAKILRVRPETITAWVRQGRLPAIKIGTKTYRFDADLITHLAFQSGTSRSSERRARANLRVR
jgi:excisionase family DNA binding protein